MNNIKDIDETLNGLSSKALAEEWCFLNMLTEACGGDYKPAIQVMREIESRIGHNACNRQWNIDRMTDEEHKEWYATGYMGMGKE